MNKIKKPITRRFFWYIVVTIIFSNILLTISISFIFRNSMEQQSTKSSISLLQRQLENVNEYLKGVDNLANSLIYNDDFIELLKRKKNTKADRDLLNSIFSIFYQSRNDLKLIVYKETEPEKAYSIYSDSGQTETGDYHASEWYHKITTSTLNRIMVSNQLSVYTDGMENEYSHAMIYRIKDQYSNKDIGYLRIDIDLQNLKKYFIGEYENVDGISIYDGDDKLLFHDKMTVAIPQGKAFGETGIFIHQDKDFITVYGDVLDIGWKMVFCVDKHRLFHDLNYITLTLAGIVLLVVWITLICSKWLFSVVTDNFKRLADGMQSVKQGNLNTQVEIGREDEIGALIAEFNGTVKTVYRLMDEVEKKQIMLKEVEIKALQQQINPHFIFNSLETVMGLASEGMNDKVITVCQGMSSMLRYNISFQNKTILKNEIVQMKNYIRLMQIRFENRFEASYDIDEQCMNAEFVKFTLQPLVENSISHGLSNCISGGLIRIMIKLQENMVAISIYDNGSGMGKKRLEEINRKIHETIEHPLEYVEQYSGLGLMNVNLRLRMHFKEQYSIEIFSKEQKGTCIYMKIPYIEV